MGNADGTDGRRDMIVIIIASFALGYLICWLMGKHFHSYHWDSWRENGVEVVYKCECGKTKVYNRIRDFA